MLYITQPLGGRTWGGMAAWYQPVQCNQCDAPGGTSVRAGELSHVGLMTVS